MQLLFTSTLDIFRKRSQENLSKNHLFFSAHSQIDVIRIRGGINITPIN